MKMKMSLLVCHPAGRNSLLTAAHSHSRKKFWRMRWHQRGARKYNRLFWWKKNNLLNNSYHFPSTQHMVLHCFLTFHCFCFIQCLHLYFVSLYLPGWILIYMYIQYSLHCDKATILTYPRKVRLRSESSFARATCSYSQHIKCRSLVSGSTLLYHHA